MNRRERKKEETRIKIIEYAVELFKDKGFEDTSMEEIAEKSDIAKGTLYNYFSDKESILSSYFQVVIKDYKDELKINMTNIQGIRNKLLNIIEFIGGMFNNSSELTTVYFKYRLKNLFLIDYLDKTKRSGIEDVICQVIIEGQRENELRNDIPAEMMARNFQFLIGSFLISFLDSEIKIDISEKKLQIIDLFLNGTKENN